MLRSQDHVFQTVPIFDKDYMNIGFHGNQIEDIVAIYVYICIYIYIYICIYIIYICI